MPYITNTAEQADGYSYTTYSGFANTNSINYQYKTPQDTLRIVNRSDKTLTVGVNGNTTTIQPYRDSSFQGPLSQFTVNSDIGVGSFCAESWKLNLPSNMLDVSKVKLYSESILGQGNFPTKIGAALNNATVIQTVWGGTLVASSLADEADEVWVPAVAENSLKYSNDLTNAVWTQSAAVTFTQETFLDGTVWNKAVKNDTTFAKGVETTSVLAFPATAKGCTLMFDMYVPTGTTPAPITSIRIAVTNTTKSVFVETYWNGFTAGRKYRVAVIYDKTNSLSTWATGDAIKIAVQMNYSDGSAPCTAYFKDFTLSWDSIALIEPYVKTTANYKTSTAPTWTKINKNPYIQNDFDVAIISFGRNDSTYITSDAYYRAYDKLVSKISEKCGNVIITNPPSGAVFASNIWDSNDKFVTKGFFAAWKRLVSKWNSGVDFNSKFRANFKVSDVMVDDAHQNTAGADIMVSDIVNAINNRKLLNGAKAELTNKVKLYLGGIPNGTGWKRSSGFGPLVPFLSDVNAYGITTSTQNEYLDFGSIEFQQLHLLHVVNSGFGRIDVILDYGTDDQMTYTFDQNAATRFDARLICDLGETKTHTVRIVAKDSGKSVKVYGVLAI